jgi:hypothetical protein
VGQLEILSTSSVVCAPVVRIGLRIVEPKYSSTAKFAEKS